MANPGEMVKRIARTLGVPEATVGARDRKLADEGLRKKGGRGLSAARVDAWDVANVITSVAATPFFNSAAEIVREYTSLPSNSGEARYTTEANTFKTDGNIAGSWGLPTFPIPELQALPREHTFGDAFVALIEAARSESLWEAADALKAATAGKFEFEAWWRVEVIFRAPQARASIHVYTNGFSEKHHYSRQPREVADIVEWAKLIDSSPTQGDLTHMHMISTNTILAMGDLLRR